MTINLKPAAKWLTKHAPEIFAGLAVGGVVITTGLTVQGTLGVKKHIEETKYEDKTKGDIVKETWREWAPPLVAGTLTITSILLSNHLHRNREAALMAVAAMWQGRYFDLENHIKELPKGDRILSDIRNKEMAENLPDRTPSLRPGEILVYEPMSKQFFVSSNQEITAAELIANKIMQREQALTLNEFLKLFRNAHTYIAGEGIGWFKTSDQWMYSWDLYGQSWIDILPYQAEIKGRPCVYLDYGVKMSTENPITPPSISGSSNKFGR